MVIELPPQTETEVADVAAALGLDSYAFVREAVEEKLRKNRFARPRTEAELIMKINEGFPESFWNRFRKLIVLRDAGTLTPEQQAELISLSDRAEAKSAERLEYLIELSRRRIVSVDDLKTLMGIRPVALYADDGD